MNLLVAESKRRWAAVSVRLPAEEWWESSSGAGQLVWLTGQKEKAAVCRHLVTASHYCTEAMKYESDQTACLNSAPFYPDIICFNEAVAGKKQTESDFVSFSCRGEEAQTGFSVCRSENSREVVSDRPPVLSQERSLSALVISNAIYISNRFLMQATC